MGHACLYGVAHAVIAALGCSPGLGFIHVGHENSFVYDIADLYKAEVTIPAAFEIAATNPAQTGSATRRLVRDRIAAAHILERMVRDIHTLLAEGEDGGTGHLDEVKLWNGTADLVANGINYAIHHTLDFLGEDWLVGHNIAFDINFLLSACRTLGVTTPFMRAIDTVQLARRILIDSAPGFRLEALAQHLRIADKQVHRALPDARITASLYLKLNGIAAAAN